MNPITVIPSPEIFQVEYLQQIYRLLDTTQPNPELPIIDENNIIDRLSGSLDHEEFKSIYGRHIIPDHLQIHSSRPIIYLTHGGILYSGETSYDDSIIHGGRTVFSGNGFVIFPGGYFYDGSFFHGIPDFYGKLVKPGGHYYMGQWKNGVLEGNGMYVYKNHDLWKSYNGWWKSGKRHGGGKIMYLTGMIELKRYMYGHEIETVAPEDAIVSHGSIQGWINNYRPSLDDREAPLSTPPNTGNRITLPPIRTIQNRNSAEYDLDNANDDNIDLEDSGSSFTSSLTSLDLSEINEDDDNASREGLQEGETEDTEDTEGRTESAEDRTEGADAQTEGADARTESADARTEGADTRTEGADARTEGAESREVEEDTEDTDGSEDIETTEGEGEVEGELDQELRENRWLLQQYRNNTRRLLKNVDSYKNKGRHYRHQYHTALTQYQRAQRDYNRLRTLFLNFKTESHRTIQQSITIIAEKNTEITRLLEVQNRLNRQASSNNTGEDGGETDGESGSGGSGGDRGSGLCKICMTNTRRIVVLPCKHFAMCRECERRNRITHTDTDTGEPMCPICRTPYTDILSIFV